MFVRIESQYWRDEDEQPNPMMRKRGRKLMTFCTGGIYIVVIFIFSPSPSSSTTRGRRGRSDGQHIIHTSVLQYIIYITCFVYSYVHTLDAILSSVNPSPAPKLQRTFYNIICEYFVVIELHYREI